VRGTLAGLLWIAACYTPQIAPGVPCSNGGLCPEGQRCTTTGVCEIPALFDAAIDAPPDKDQDGIPDMMDNCPDVANPDQANEDGDKFGDACDPCPPFRDELSSDLDRDGVPNACDPNLMVTGDRIELFEGFHHGVPAWMRTGTWTTSGDAVRIEAAANVSEYLVVPVEPPLDHVTLYASLVVESVVSAPDHFVDVSLPNDAASNLGIECELYQPVAATGRYLSLWDGFATAPGREFGNAVLGWMENSEYILSLKRVGSTYTCNATDPAPTNLVMFPPTGTPTSTSLPATPTAMIRVRSATARVNWIMVVRSP
jgi:hypothetical protein